MNPDCESRRSHSNFIYVNTIDTSASNLTALPEQHHVRTTGPEFRLSAAPIPTDKPIAIIRFIRLYYAYKTAVLIRAWVPIAGAGPVNRSTENWDSILGD